MKHSYFRKNENHLVCCDFSKPATWGAASGFFEWLVRYGVDSNDSYFVCHVPSMVENMNVSYFQVGFFTNNYKYESFVLLVGYRNG